MFRARKILSFRIICRLNSRLFSARVVTSFERGFIMVNVSDLTLEQKKELIFTQEDSEALERARNMPITFDIDCPETTPERAVKFRRVNPPRKTKTANPA